ncbi:hypothetical protein CEUSTIGMA_g3159.t1 [Chlamydomonas eustigma]|uniref:Uncharacterized protein n=1 Tax=Chlamydomonas eustigma TaxID=1157962 RepID=A0A250WY58_9CHLO|nr:hypothetical protein CEUSTIGMA_g3159.t1 [Chlamydomonas eustigma]|eukprot:GAX75716.1 hypothetical protein CEUSTIGMA_g3159.t1 [Chlamydomonas eustigma]
MPEKEGEDSRLQLLLSSIPELRDDEVMLSQLRVVFQEHCYCPIGEEKDIVSLEDFETWWRSLDDEGVEMIAGALMSNLGKMEVFVRSTGLEDHAECFRSSIECMQQQQWSPSRQLSLFTFKRDVVKGLQGVAEKTFVRDFKEACNIMYDLLVCNGDLLDMQASKIRPPSSVKSQPEYVELLVEHMQLMINILQYCMPRRQLQMDFLTESVVQLKGIIAKPAEAAKKAGMPSIANRLAMREGLRVKYGATLTTDTMIKDYQIALGRLVATSRGQIRNISLAKHTADKAKECRRKLSQNGVSAMAETPPKMQVQVSAGCTVSSLADLRSRLIEERSKFNSQRLSMEAYRLGMRPGTLDLQDDSATESPQDDMPCLPRTSISRAEDRTRLSSSTFSSGITFGSCKCHAAPMKHGDSRSEDLISSSGSHSWHPAHQSTRTTSASGVMARPASQGMSFPSMSTGQVKAGFMHSGEAMHRNSFASTSLYQRTSSPGFSCGPLNGGSHNALMSTEGSRRSNLGANSGFESSVPCLQALPKYRTTVSGCPTVSFDDHPAPALLPKLVL